MPPTVDDISYMLPVLMAGTSYKNCPLEVRERLAPSPSRVSEWLDALRPLAREAVVLSTCHRLEIYASPHSPTILPSQLLKTVAPAELLSGFYSAQGEDAVRHLFRVSAGLDSAVTGESQILSQVRQALEMARSQGGCGPILSAAFQHATSTGKRVRASGLGGGYASLGAAAIDMAGWMMGQLNGKSALIIGAGKVGELAGQALRQKGIASIAVTSRTFARSRQLAGTIEARAIAFNDLSSALSSCHLMLTATTSPHWVVTHQTVAEAMTGREEPLLIIDLAVPRDVEPSAATIPGVSLVNVDDLVEQMGLAAPQPVKGIAQAETIVAAGVAGFGKWLLERRAAPTITTLYERADEMCQSELDRARPHLAGMSAEEWKTVQRLTRAICRKFLHPTVARLRTEAAAGNGYKYDGTVNHLFSMGGDKHGKAR